ncbi:MAG: hypothetical protein GXO04_02125 [Aquificae bacterium]|nr:hypothetical protein [Aquificota bacterium]
MSKEVLLNLYPLNFSFQKAKFTVFESKPQVPPSEASKVRYRLSRALRRPVFRRGERFYVLGSVSKTSVPITTEGDKLYILKSSGTERIDGFESAREAQELFRDSVELRDVKRLWLAYYYRKHKEELQVSWRHGKAYLIPEIKERVRKADEKLLLQVDVRHRIVSGETLQELLEKGIPLRNLRVKPMRLEFSASVEGITRAEEFDEEFFKQKARISVHEITRRAWERLAQDPRLRERTYIVKLSGGYVYPAFILKVVIDLDDFDEKELLYLLPKVKLSPSERLSLIRSIVKLYASHLRAYSWDIKQTEERSDGTIDYLNTLTDKKGKKSRIFTNMRKFLQACTPFTKKERIDAGVITVEKSVSGKGELRRKAFLNKLKNFLSEKGIELNITDTTTIVARTRQEAKRELTKRMEHFYEKDLVIAFLDEYEKANPYEELLLYDFVKTQLLAKGVPSQIVLNKTLTKSGLDFIVTNVAEQVLAKTGNVPYKLAGRLKAGDVFVGYDASRKTHKGKVLRSASFTKIFLPDGTFLRYKITSSHSGEEITKKAIEELFVFLSQTFPEGKKRVVIHRDGRFTRSEIRNFILFSNNYNFPVELVEIVKRENPRFFGGKLIKGHYYKLGQNTLILATYNNLYTGTHNPILVRKVYGEMPVEEHASAILSLTLLNYASFQPTRLPATTNWADKITKLMLRGIEPPNTEGDIMYWL